MILFVKLKWLSQFWIGILLKIKVETHIQADRKSKWGSVVWVWGAPHGCMTSFNTWACSWCDECHQGSSGGRVNSWVSAAFNPSNWAHLGLLNWGPDVKPQQHINTLTAAGLFSLSMSAPSLVCWFLFKPFFDKALFISHHNCFTFLLVKAKSQVMTLMRQPIISRGISSQKTEASGSVCTTM